MADGAYESGENLAACAEYPPHPVELVTPGRRTADPAVHKSAFALDLAAEFGAGLRRLNHERREALARELERGRVKQDTSAMETGR